MSCTLNPKMRICLKETAECAACGWNDEVAQDRHIEIRYGGLKRDENGLRGLTVHARTVDRIKSKDWKVKA